MEGLLCFQGWVHVRPTCFHRRSVGDCMLLLVASECSCWLPVVDCVLVVIGETVTVAAVAAMGVQVNEWILKGCLPIRVITLTLSGNIPEHQNEWLEDDKIGDSVKRYGLTKDHVESVLANEHVVVKRGQQIIEVNS